MARINAGHILKQATKKIAFSLLAIGLAAALAFPQAVPSAPRGRSATSRVMMRRGYLGVGVADLTPDRVKALNLKDDSGIEVKHLDENSPASRAGLRENDVILEMNRQKVEDIEQFVRAIGETTPGTKIDMAIWRSGARQNLSATVEVRSVPIASWGPDLPDLPMPPMPAAPPTAHGDGSFLVVQAPLIGMEGEGLGGQLAEFFGVKSGVLVRSVSPGTPAARAGLKAGDVVTKVNAMTVTSSREIWAMVRASRRNKIPLSVVREKKDLTLALELPQ